MSVSSHSSAKTPQGTLLVVCGPSGAGKNTLVERLLEGRADAVFSVSATTRPPRPGERDGVDYRFVDEAEFDRLLASGGLLEWAEYAGHRYGTPSDAVERELAAGRHVVAIVELSGATQIRQALPQAKTVFLTLEYAELARRLALRGDDPGQVVRRLAIAQAELVYGPTQCGVVVDATDGDSALAALSGLLGLELPDR